VACSGRLEGDRVEVPVSDWSAVASAGEVAFATESGHRFRAVAAEPLVHEGELYLHVTSFLPYGDDALDAVLAGERIEMSADGKLYLLRATRLTETADIDRILPTFVRKSLKIEATGVRFDPKPARYPGTQARQWFFRLESAPPADS
jgi:hypothetical protein